MDSDNTKNSLTSLANGKGLSRREEQLLSEALGVKAELTADQERSLRHITLEAGSIKLVQGFAGTGKTQLLIAAGLVKPFGHSMPMTFPRISSNSQ